MLKLCLNPVGHRLAVWHWGSLYHEPVSPFEMGWELLPRVPMRSPWASRKGLEVAQRIAWLWLDCKLQKRAGTKRGYLSHAALNVEICSRPVCPASWHVYLKSGFLARHAVFRGPWGRVLASHWVPIPGGFHKPPHSAFKIVWMTHVENGPKFTNT